MSWGVPSSLLDLVEGPAVRGVESPNRAVGRDTGAAVRRIDVARPERASLSAGAAGGRCATPVPEHVAGTHGAGAPYASCSSRTASDADRDERALAIPQTLVVLTDEYRPLIDCGLEHDVCLAGIEVALRTTARLDPRCRCVVRSGFARSVRVGAVPGRPGLRRRTALFPVPGGLDVLHDREVGRVRRRPLVMAPS